MRDYWLLINNLNVKDNIYRITSNLVKTKKCKKYRNYYSDLIQLIIIYFFLRP